jgi:hypothetical protein
LQHYNGCVVFPTHRACGWSNSKSLETEGRVAIRRHPELGSGDTEDAAQPWMLKRVQHDDDVAKLGFK